MLFLTIDIFVPIKNTRNLKYPPCVSLRLKNLIVKKKIAYKIFKVTDLSKDYNTFSYLHAQCKRQSKLDHGNYLTYTQNSMPY